MSSDDWETFYGILKCDDHCHAEEEAFGISFAFLRILIQRQISN